MKAVNTLAAAPTAVEGSVHQSVVCPHCLSRKARERQSVSVLHKALGLLGFRFYRCRRCFRRFVWF